MRRVSSIPMRTIASAAVATRSRGDETAEFAARRMAAVSNLDQVVESCEAAGYSVAVAPREIRPRVRISMVEDPDGNWVELLESS